MSESNLVIHARRELELIGEDPEFIEGIVKVVQAFSECGHSGSSAQVAIYALNDLLRFVNLSPLTDDPDEWNDVSPNDEEDLWQSQRNPEAFSLDRGQTYYLLSDAAHGMKTKPFYPTVHKEVK